MSADLLNGFPPSKPVKKNQKCRFLELRMWISAVDKLGVGSFPTLSWTRVLAVFQRRVPWLMLLWEMKLHDGGRWLRMDIYGLFLPVCVCVCVRGHTPSLVASESCCPSACATFDSKATPALTECAVFNVPPSSAPPHQHAAAAQGVTLLLAWNLFSFGNDAWLVLCVFIYCPIVPSADTNRLLKCSRRHKILCVDCAKSLHKP